MKLNDSKLFGGVDVGGTTIKCALATEDGTILTQGVIPTDSHEGPDDVLNRVGAYVNSLADEVGVDHLQALGMGLPGLIEIHRGVTKYLPNLTTHWIDVPVSEKLSAIVNCPVHLLNDVRTATLGELIFGSGKSVGTMVFMAIGTGIGGGIVIDGKLRLGPLGAAGEIGHQTIDRTGPLCGCGNHGCLETLASGTALTAEGIRLMLMGLAPTLHDEVHGDPGEVSVEIMGRVADQDEPVRDAILNAAADIAIGVANIITTIHPELVVIGGGVAKLGSLLFDRIRQDVEDRIGRLFPVDGIRIESSQLEEKAGVLGAIALAIHGLPE